MNTQRHTLTDIFRERHLNTKTHTHTERDTHAEIQTLPLRTRHIKPHQRHIDTRTKRHKH